MTWSHEKQEVACGHRSGSLSHQTDNCSHWLFDGGYGKTPVAKPVEDQEEEIFPP